MAPLVPLVGLTLLCMHQVPTANTFMFAPRSPRASSGPEVNTRYGALRGVRLRSEQGQPYDAFFGIPYAAPPVGQLRFKSPQPPIPWLGVRKAIEEGPICVQGSIDVARALDRLPSSVTAIYPSDVQSFLRARPYIMRFAVKFLQASEDCLFLNVYRPKRSRLGYQEGLPVLVWIHGGAFLFGDGGYAVYGPDYLVDQDIIVVTLNYRLGPLGHLSLGPGSGVPGNAASKDQVAALRWVRDNIAAFGGDPNKVTIYGQSAGGAYVHLHVLSPMSAGLFRAAIAASGSALNYWSVTKHGQERARRLVDVLGCSGDSVNATLECLQRASARDINAMHEKALNEEDHRFFPGKIAFAPVVEQPEPGEEAFLPDEPGNLLASGRYNKVPIIFSSVDAEALILFTGVTRPPNMKTLRLPETNQTILVPDELYYSLSPDERVAVGQKIKRFYLGDGPVTMDKFDGFCDMISDLYVQTGQFQAARLHAAAENAPPVYVSEFSFDGEWNLLKKLIRIKANRASHADDLGYVFVPRAVPLKQVTPSAPEVAVRRRLSTMLGDFIKTGNPTPRMSRAVGAIWEPYKVSNPRYLEIGRELTPRKVFHPKRTKFWDDLYIGTVDTPMYRRLKEISPLSQ